jgi:ATP-dependent Clp protease ATP-binding subunit ClpC
MFVPFTDQVREVLTLAHQEACRLGHEYVGTEHLLLGLLAEGKSFGASALKELGVTLDGARDEVERIIQLGPHTPTTGKLPFSRRAKQAIELSIEESRGLERDEVDTEHLLVGLVREHGGVAAQVLRNHNVTVDEAREKVLDVIRRPPGGDRDEPSGES